MDPSKSSAVELTKRVDDICNALIGHFHTIVFATKENADADHSAIAQNELTIVEKTNAMIQSTQDLSSLIRELQELWLFGGLDTLADPSDEETNKAKAQAIAKMIETIAKSKPAPEQNVQNGESAQASGSEQAPAKPCKKKPTTPPVLPLELDTSPQSLDLDSNRNVGNSLATESSYTISAGQNTDETTTLRPSGSVNRDETETGDIKADKDEVMRD
ncbi:hypothetical protein CC78DRAFT_611957 [Lojkania enalia]|uniref:Uncharacterized protein n=1 Tax=Lojkania enalia TaxID=147567 RepID=A0A9P4TQT0_9PLEO|nr:hypothetical protein CC78DRAFT_611957 [Didymosphaeria enalia]